MNLSPLPLQKFFDNNGRPLVGGQLFTYEAGTNNKIATYQDQAGTPNTNPVVLNFRGEANVWLDQTLTYKFVLARENDTDPPTNPIWTVDNITAAVTFASLTAQIIGRILWPRTAAEISANVTPVNYAYPPGHLQRYVSDVSGGADMSSQLQAAINTGYSIFWPDGTIVKASGVNMVADGQYIYTGGRGAKWVANLNSTWAIRLPGNRQGVTGITFDTGGLAANDTESTFNAVRITGSRCIVDHITCFGVWTYAVSFVSALYSHVQFSNIDGFRKRAVSIFQGSDNWVEGNMILEASLVSPVEGSVYVDNAPATWIQRNNITRGKGAGIFAVASSPLNTGLFIDYNNIDFLEGWAIDVNGYWNAHITDNWCAGGQSVSVPAGQIRCTSVRLSYIAENDINGALLTSRGLLLDICSYVLVERNTAQYCQNNIVVNASDHIIVSHNISGQMTGLPPTGVVTQNSYVESACSLNCDVQFLYNMSVSPAVAAYSGITFANVVADGYSNSRYNSQSSNYTLTINDRNAIVTMGGGVSTLTLPVSIFSAGDQITVIAGNGGTAYTIAQGGGVTLFWANGTTTSGNRTLTGVGYAVITWISSTTAFITGTGIT